jgi:glycosyltransferase involved in cell wall biosynthesis
VLDDTAAEWAGSLPGRLTDSTARLNRTMQRRHGESRGLESGRPSGMVTLRTLFPFGCNNVRVGHILLSLVRHLSETDLRAELWVMRRGPRARAKYVRTAIPGKVVSVIERANGVIQPRRNWARAILEHRYAAAFRPGDVAYVYRGCSLELLRALKARGHRVFLERAIIMDHMAKRISDDAFARAGWLVEPLFAQSRLDAEQAQVDTADFVFSPSPAVTASLRERGVPDQKILQTSYGWDPERFRTTAPALPPIQGVTVLFVGSIEIRKGAHLLLEAWSRAGITGRLVLAGEMEPLIARYCGEHLKRKDVIHLPFHPDPAPVYRSADIFGFPTLEEGSPLVSYEALANGLPVVTTPMGAGNVIRHRREGLVVEPHDQHALIGALRELAGDAEKRRGMGEAGRIRAADYTWDKVAQRRYELIKEALSRR